MPDARQTAARAREAFVSGMRRIGLAQPAPPPAPEPGLPGSSQALDARGVATQRAELARRFSQLQWDLGGLTYEMAIRDHFRLDVLVSRAAELQAVEGELAEAERLLRLEDAGAAGACPSCGSLYARGAVFCWHCGHRLLQPGSNYSPAAPPRGAVPRVADGALEADTAVSPRPVAAPAPAPAPSRRPVPPKVMAPPPPPPVPPPSFLQREPGSGPNGAGDEPRSDPEGPEPQ